MSVYTYARYLISVLIIPLAPDSITGGTYQNIVWLAIFPTFSGDKNTVRTRSFSFDSTRSGFQGGTVHPRLPLFPNNIQYGGFYWFLPPDQAAEQLTYILLLNQPSLHANIHG